MISRKRVRVRMAGERMKLAGFWFSVGGALVWLVCQPHFVFA